jgi:hypothetical protein
MGTMMFSLAEILKKIRDSELYIPLGYDTFVEYVQNPEVGLNVRTAYYYIEIYETYIEKLKYTPEQLSEYSYDKLRRLIPIVNGRSDTQEVMEKALSLRWSDFSKQYKDDKANEGYEDYLPTPEFYRCSCHSKWVISIPLSECCESYLREMYNILRKRFDNEEKRIIIGDEK